MPAYFLDSSALVKRWIQEVGSERVRALTALGAADRVYVARLAGPEVVGAISRRHRGAGLDEAARKRLIGVVRREIIERIRVVEITPEIWESATSLAAEHALRGADAVHVAAAMAVKGIHDATDLDQLVFVMADREQGLAASEIGLKTEML